MKVAEALTQVFAGAVLIFLANLLTMPLLGIEATVQANAYLVAVNTVVSFCKAYTVREIFSWYDA